MTDAPADPGGTEAARPRLSRNLRDALRFLHDNARQRITIPDIAAAVGMSPRGLQTAFQRELGTSPSTYLRAVRLEGVRRDLQSEQPRGRSTIAEVASRWHFSNAGRMASEYRALFGNAPSAGLRYFDPDAGDLPDRVAAQRGPGRRFRVVLDCEVDVDDSEDTLAAAAAAAAAADQDSWNDYQPDGTTEDLVAYLLGRAVRQTIEDTHGVQLLAANPLLRVPDAQGGYASAELPAFWPTARPRRTAVVRSAEEEDDTDD